jgi:hypothetical protein
MEGMMMRDQAQQATGSANKRMLAAGRKINGTWEVRTFLRFAAERTPFWEATRRGGDAGRRRKK